MCGHPFTVVLPQVEVLDDAAPANPMSGYYVPQDPLSEMDYHRRTRESVAADLEAMSRPAPPPVPAQPAARPTPAKKKDGWYVLTDRGEIGPLDSKQIVQAARRGLITPAQLMRHSTKPGFVKAGSVPGLFAKAPANPPPPKAEPQPQRPAAP